MLPFFSYSTFSNVVISFVFFSYLQVRVSETPTSSVPRIKHERNGKLQSKGTNTSSVPHKVSILCKDEATSFNIIFSYAVDESQETYDKFN